MALTSTRALKGALRAVAEGRVTRGRLGWRVDGGLQGSAMRGALSDLLAEGYIQLMGRTLYAVTIPKGRDLEATWSAEDAACRARTPRAPIRREGRR